MSKGRKSYYTVIEECDHSLVCNCSAFGQTGKTCEHIFAARLQRDHGPVEEHEDIETVRKERGTQARGRRTSFSVSQRTKGRRTQARPDNMVDEEVHSFFDKIAQGVELFNESSGDDNGVPGFGVPESNCSAKVLPGRPTNISPLHPGRSRHLGQKPTQPKSPENVRSKPVVFQNKPGPKRKPHNSLLPAIPKDKQLTIAANHRPAAASDPLDSDSKRGGFLDEEIQMMKLGLEHWDSQWQLRQDELRHFTEILNVLSSYNRIGAIFFPESYVSSARVLSEINDSLLEGDNPFSPTHAIFETDSIYGSIYRNSQLQAVKWAFFFHFDAQRMHWVLYRYSYGSGIVECFDSLDSHSDTGDMWPLRFTAAYFHPDRPTVISPSATQGSCSVHRIGVQDDGVSCGFWAVTFALLLMFHVDVKSNLIRATLTGLCVSVFRTHLKEIWTSFATDKEGLQRKPLEKMLSRFNVFLPSGDPGTCIAPRPSTIARSEIINHMDHLQSDESETERLEVLENLPWREEMAKEFIAKIEEQNLKLMCGGQQVFAADLKRLLPGNQINDEIINMWIAMCPIDDGVHVCSTFHYPNFLEAHLGTRPWLKCIRRFKDITFKNDVRRFVFPIHLAEEHHWVVALVDVEIHVIAIYDSWGPTNARNRQQTSWKTSTHSLVISVLRDWQEAMLAARGYAVSWDEWTMIPAVVGIPTQSNTVDCGVFTMLFLSRLASPSRFSMEDVTEFHDDLIRITRVDAILEGFAVIPEVALNVPDQSVLSNSEATPAVEEGAISHNDIAEKVISPILRNTPDPDIKPGEPARLQPRALYHTNQLTSLFLPQPQANTDLPNGIPSSPLSSLSSLASPCVVEEDKSKTIVKIPVMSSVTIAEEVHQEDHKSATPYATM
ncbi:hypothetical protein BJ138DRAFT_1119193 [Hygrophoropsis aurantiaca]|uniref:Uncharacterized protein n=1 Tax=Hygrophoropsis aurantiaca TaxID=72124 RepID=A0ACB7ZVH6_9AGAM|nr:hypothetical protein BJ138DRAFT_1119193 [Hygrophoropsis aurantiaca]